MTRTRVSMVSAILVSAWLSFSAFAAHSAIDPAPRTDGGWKGRQEALNKRATEAGDKAQVIFIGDSITQGWEGAGKKAWEENYSKYNAVNLGIGGDRTQHVLWRLENGNLESLHPKAAVLMIGTNNSNGEDNTVEQIAEGVQTIVKKLREKLPSTKILLCAIFPRGENPNPQRGKILQVNQIIRKLADNQNVLWVDFGQKFIDEQGRISREIMPDYLHLSEQGYQIWVDSLRGPLNRALGETPGRAAGRSALNGEWLATMPGPNNEPIHFPFEVRVEGSRVNGAFKPEGRGPLKIENGQINGNDFSWTITRGRPDGGTLTYKMKGTLQGDSIKGTASTSIEGNDVTTDWTAKRQ